VTGILLIVVTGIFVLLTTVLVAPVFWIISGVWAYYDAKNYNREAGFTRKGTDSEEEEEVESDEEEEVESDEEEEVESDEEEEVESDEEEEVESDEEEEVESDEEEEVDPSEVLLDELRALHSTLRNGVTVASILLLIILGLMLYLLLHFTRFVLAP